MPVDIRNPWPSDFTMPAPFKGILTQGRTITLDYTVASFQTAIGGAGNQGHLQVTDNPGATSFDTSFMPVAGPYTSLEVSGDATIGDDLAVTDDVTIGGDTLMSAGSLTLTTGNIAFTNASSGAKTISVPGSLAATLVGASLALSAGAGGAASAGAAGGAGGALTATSGVGGAAGADQIGGASGALTLRTGTGGAGSAAQAAGASGVLTLRSGDGGADGGGGGAASGNVIVDTGAATGAATNGALTLGATSAESVTIGRTGKTTTIPGALAVTQTTTLTGNVGVGGAPVTSAAFAVTSTTQGLLFPRMTEAERDAIATPAAGLTIYNTTTGKLNVFTTAWEVITSA